MANSRSGSSNGGCGTVIAAVVLIAVIAAVVGAIAEQFTNVAIWMQYGTAGLPPLEARNVAYPLAWGLFFAFLLAMGIAGAVLIYEFRRRRRFREYVGRMRPPVPPAARPPAKR